MGMIPRILTMIIGRTGFGRDQIYPDIFHDIIISNVISVIITGWWLTYPSEK